MTPDSLKQARVQIDVAGTTSFSFDIFDTFLFRRCTAPDGVYERAFQLAPIPVDRRSMVESFVQNRMVAEHKARQLKWATEQKTEVTIEDIYAQYPIHTLGLSASERASLAGAEFQAELDLCVLNPDVYSVYQAAQTRGLRVGFISDMYWTAAQLEQLLRHLVPDLSFDFLFSSSEFGLGKANGLIGHYLQTERLAASQAVHIGDNPHADVAAASKLGVRAIHYPQAPGRLHALLQQESATAQLIRTQHSTVSRRLDGGLAVLRRMAAGEMHGDETAVRTVGSLVLGPIMVAFQRFIERRVAELRSNGRRTALLFLGRDGFLPFRLGSQGGQSTYVEVIRQLAASAGEDGARLLDYLRQTIIGFDDSTDIVLVDMGSSGTPQRLLRGLFERHRLDKALHGIYFMPFDHQLADLGGEDSVSGFLDDGILTPQIKALLRRNFAIVQQLCRALVGPARDYDGGVVLREEDRRPIEQRQLCGEVQDHCILFAESYGDWAGKVGADPLGDADLAPLRAAILLCRFLLAPSADEQRLFSRLQHDVDAIGMVDMIDAPAVDMLSKAVALPVIYAAGEPPMWLAGSLPAVSPLAAHLYALAGFGLVPDQVLADADLGTVNANLVKGDQGFKVPVSIALTCMKELRLRAAILKHHTGSILALPLKGMPQSGVIRSLTLQTGQDGNQALRSGRVTALSVDAINGMRADIKNGHFQAAGVDPHLLIAVPPSDQQISILTMTISPLSASVA